MSAFFRYIGFHCLAFLHYLGELALLGWETLVSICTAPIRWRLFFIQMQEVGFRSQLVVIVTGSFVGAVFAAQTYFQFHQLGMDTAVGAVVAVSMYRELGPVLTGLDGFRPRGRGHVRRNRHDESHRADRRAARAGGLPD